MRTAQANPSTTQSNTALIPAEAGKSVKIFGVFISSDTAITVSLVNSATHDLLWRQYVGATGGSGMPVALFPLVTSTAGEGVDYSTSGNANVFLSVTYDV
jgi:hypothetical protein